MASHQLSSERNCHGGASAKSYTHSLDDTVALFGAVVLSKMELP